MINKIGVQNPYKISKVSFGLNDTNLRAIEALYSNNQDRFVREQAIKSIDMKDEDIAPVLKELSSLLSSPKSSNSDLNAVLDKVKDFDGGIDELKDGFSGLMTRWPVLFLSVRAKASDIMDKFGLIHPKTGGLSRTTCNPLFGETAIRNLEDSERYINLVIGKGKCPDKQFLLGLHKIITKDLSYIDTEGKAYQNSQYSGIVRGSSEDKIAKPHEITDTNERLDKFFNWLSRNYDKNEPFFLAAQCYKKLLGITPFYDGNGRTLRGFTDAILLSKGYKFKQYPNNYAEVRNYETNELANLIKENCEQV